MTKYFESAIIYTTKTQNALGTQFVIFPAFDNQEDRRGIFLVDLGSLPTLDPNDQDGLTNAIKQNLKKLVFQDDNDPFRRELTKNGHGHVMFDVAGNDNILCIGWSIKEGSDHVLTLAALRSGQVNNSNTNVIKFEKCPNASRPIPNIAGIEDLKVLVIGNDPKLHHIAKVNDQLYSVEMAGH
jgi:hypothetical protein